MNQMFRADTDRAQEFEGRVIGMINDGALCLTVAIGHRTGLFDTMAGMAWANSAEIAKAADLQERYVREWLGAMTVGRIVDHDPDTGTYRLPDEHARVLTRDGEGDNMAVAAQIIPVLAGVETDIVDCFREGGGVPYERFERFHEVMMEDSNQTVVPNLVDKILPLVDGLVGKLERGIRVLDVGCGRGRALNSLAAAFPNSTFVGYDLSDDAIAFARAEARQQGSTNVAFYSRDVTDLEATVEAAAFDLVLTFDAIHDQADPMAVLRGIRRALKHDGVYICQDIRGSHHHHGNMDHPLAPFLYTVSTMHCMTVSLAQGGEGLGTMWGCETALSYMADAGFSSVTQYELEHDIMNVYYVCRP
ncbi:class I SAM-dependent methyltransferase [Microbaculum marinisediminis]|uniref:Class I SAM-dependent methyltransferase n=1 Tax=Microbaculum marinisediminis TaxID=2931392 RepID=A0AAW5QWH6_9HYPH|nr:class I SAM-dependent methyltransferase [Microbaculum sp. A6E488]MCT8972426.1 class I SAM-dependent methyltransferase [Microbaculum sp. A6E488]